VILATGQYIEPPAELFHWEGIFMVCALAPKLNIYCSLHIHERQTQQISGMPQSPLLPTGVANKKTRQSPTHVGLCNVGARLCHSAAAHTTGGSWA
jgi:hypothetical protein